ncbi:MULTISPECIES: cell wall hydrolase [unclassified Sphingomonas]|uniref:cell wall hydrolase n=1 Tax=unclassified Sphingomonas TaxID=196159 RepID=UPI0006F7B352|nr:MULTISPECIES: cell wall hydrolase [unclassified Sphingomonas]KQX20721.1 cell wall hydrolase [Sphingomonas sp. Root1294]KQY68567.1 cell wall hydrolase [Sphingomonas sp. Root50]KRB87973.1 cell wall hydrolase [Sphingomonas sp. Root720]
MSAKLAQHPLMLAAMLIAAATGAMGIAAIPASQPTLAYQVTPQFVADDAVADDGIDEVLFKEAVNTSKVDRQLECMAKVVLHEAANQTRSGQLAVAQVIMNRVGQDRFGENVCEVVNQPGQFFHTASFNPRRDTDRWATAVEVSRQAMAGDADQVVPGAVFYHSAHQPPNRFFRTRQRLSMVGDHVFYR